MSNIRYILQPYGGPGTRYRCPECGQARQLTRYLDTETGDLLPEHVGRCNREQSCGYHYTPKQHFEATKPLFRDNERHIPPPRPKAKPVAPPPIQFLPLDLVGKTMAGYSQNNFIAGLKALFGTAVARELTARYFIGTSKHWNGATVFFQIDIESKLRQAKVMLYNAKTLKRVKNEQSAQKWNTSTGEWDHDQSKGDKVYFAGKSLMSYIEVNLRQCFFGEHLLTEHPAATVGLVESEKTAIMASVYFPKLIWLATGGKNGCKWTDPDTFKVFRGREVVLFPDLGAYEDWLVKADQVKKAVSCKLMVSDLLETIATEQQRSEGLDLADYLVIKDGRQGWAMCEHGYPIMWDSNIVNV